jgi:cell division protein FtsA
MPKKSDNNLFVGLDIGTSKVVAIVAEELPDGRLDIIGVGSHPSKGMKKSIVVNIDAMVNSLQRAVEEAELMSGCQIHSVYTGIAGSHIRSMNSHGVVAIESGVVEQKDIDKVIDAAKAVAISADQKILHVIPQEYIIDAQSGIKDPLAMSGVRLEVRVHMVTGAVSVAQNIVNCIRRIGLDVDDLILEQIASSHAVLSQDEKQLGVCMIDIGGGTTDIAVFIGGAISHTFVFPVAGDQVSNDIAVALRTASVSAEEIKIKHGTALSQMSDPEHLIMVPNVGSDEEREINQQELAYVIESRFEELFVLIKNELRTKGLDKFLTAGVVLTGGSSKMPGVVELAAEIFKTNVRLGVPRNVLGMQDVIKNPIYSTGIGLLMWGQKVQTELDATQGKTHSMARIFTRMKSWFQGNF